MDYSTIISRIKKITARDTGFPRCLSCLPPADRPGELYAAGEIPRQSAIAIVGTRSPDAHGIALAKKVAKECALRDIPVISGGANGIDGAAHESCIESGGKTLVILAGGLENPHPPASAELFARAVESGGCLLSDSPPSLPVRRYLFLRRNRLIAALAKCVIIVQARYRSGALSTASWASTCRVLLYAAAGSPVNPLYWGTNKLIAAGRAKIIVSLDSFFKGISNLLQQEKLSLTAAQSIHEAVGIQLEGLEREVIRIAGTEPLSIDEIAITLHIDIKKISQAVFDLEMKGLLCAADPGRYIVSPEVLLEKKGGFPTENV